MNYRFINKLAEDSERFAKYNLFGDPAKQVEEAYRQEELLAPRDILELRNTTNTLRAKNETQPTPLQQLNSQRNPSSDKNMDVLNQYMAQYSPEALNFNRTLMADQFGYLDKIGDKDYTRAKEASEIRHGYDKDINSQLHGFDKEKMGLDFDYKTKENEQLHGFDKEIKNMGFAMDLAMKHQDFQDEAFFQREELNNFLQRDELNANANLQANFMNNLTGWQTGMANAFAQIIG